MLTMIKKVDSSKVHVYVVEFVHQNNCTEFHQIFATSIKDARHRAGILKWHLFIDFIPLSKVRTYVYRRSY